MTLTPLPLPAARAALLLALLAGAPAFAQYKYVDEKGVTVYTDQPPPSGARGGAALDLGRGGPSADALAGLPYSLAQAVRKAPVTLYTQSGCAPCDLGRDLLKARGVPYTERTLPTGADLDAFRKLGFSEFLPALTVGATRLANYNPDDWRAALDAAGYPRSSVLPRSWRNPEPAPLVATGAQPAPATAPGRPAVEPDPTPASSTPAPATPPGFRF
ncbi:DUF4124 domain-containing protein [Derxia gummosa]|uniref:DUF4124 domain-containing protein n=1 Tax=Derxia gummosa DSM 723 TaxID=1121388 RepID=A0A8B6X1A8_9BURK|nr:DUF4124 domain-containing protein [Derxia gummosa]